MALGRRRARRDDHLADAGSGSGVDNAWRIHNAQEAWTQKADVKASVLLALEGGAILAVLAANSDTGLLAHAAGVERVLELLGIVSLVAAAGAAVWTLLPQLGSPAEHKATFRHHTVYLAHLRHWGPGRAGSGFARTDAATHSSCSLDSSSR